MFGTFNITSAQVATRIQELAARHAGSVPYGRARVRWVAVQREGTWQVAMCSARVFSTTGEPDRRSSRVFASTLMIEEWLTLDELCARLRTLPTTEPTLVAGQSLTFSQSSAYWSADFHPTDAPRGPEHRFTLNGGSVALPNEPLLDYDQPFYRVTDAIREWCEVPGTFGGSDARLGSLSVRCPELRAVFSSVAWNGTMLTLGVAAPGTDPATLRVKGAWRRGDHWHGDALAVIDARVDVAAVDLPIPTGAETVETYLIGPGNEIFDAIEPTRCRASEPNRSLAAEEKIRAASRGGENEEVEFKAFVDPDDQKMDELRRTVVAFANAHGGAIFIGVRDDTTVCGVSTDIAKWAARKSAGTPPALDVARERYQGEIRQKLTGAADPTVAVETTYAMVEGKLVLVVDVPKGADPPYVMAESRDCFIRRGSSNRRPYPEELRNLSVPARRRIW